MRKNFRTIKASLIMGILLVSVVIAMIPNSSVKAQGGLFGYASIVYIDWENVNESDIAVKPLEDFKPYKLRVEYSLTKGPFGNLIYRTLYVGRRVDIKLELIDYPKEWSTVFLPFDTLTVNLPRDINVILKRSITLMISVDETAPAFNSGTISIRATVAKIGMIEKFDQTIQLTFKPDYLPMLDVQPETQHKIIGPMDTAEIPIRVTNLGNARTKAQFRITNLPEDWMAIVTDQIILETQQTGTVFINIKPPKGFGYHDDYETFIIEYIPLWAENVQVRGVTEQISVAVESRGISVIGIEVIIPIIAIIILIIFALYYLYNKMIRK